MRVRQLYSGGNEARGVNVSCYTGLPVRADHILCNVM